MLIIFFIPEAFFCILGGIALTAALGLGQASQSLAVWVAENYGVVVLITIGLALAATCFYAKSVNVRSAIAGLFAISSPCCLLLDTMYDAFCAVKADANGWLVWVIAVPLLLLYLAVHAGVLVMGFAHSAETGKSGRLWLIGAAGWIVTMVLFG